ncbi:MAG: hypothetical protein ACP5XB_26835, partial [Isosphaeraceae bacterium]
MDLKNTRNGDMADLRLTSGRLGARGVIGVLLSSALLVCGWRQPSMGQEPAPKAAAQPGDAQALSAHYRFLERYTDDPTKTDFLNSYRVATLETVKMRTENPQGAPSSNQMVVQTIYTERVAKLTKDGQVAELIRRYDRASLKSTLEIRPFKTKLLENMTILYRLQPSVVPEVLSLTGRQMRQAEYNTIVQQTFLPGLVMMLPPQPVRVGDTWTIPRMAAWALLGSQPSRDGYDLMGEVLPIRKNTTGKSMTAVFAVKGQCLVEQGPSGINAIIEFTFDPSPAQAGSGTGGRTTLPASPSSLFPKPDQTGEGNFDAPGYLSKIRLAQETTQLIGDEDSRLKQMVRREVRLERRLVDKAREPGAGTLEVPNPLPSATVENSWLIYDDPAGRLHLLHPQEMKVAKQYPDGGVDLLDRRPDGQDVIQLVLVPKTGDPRRDRLAADPIQEKKQLEDEWKRRGVKVLPGTSGWLPESDWAKFKRKVYRIEAALITQEEPSAPASGRIYLDQYTV